MEDNKGNNMQNYQIKEECDVSIIVVTYNSKWNDIKFTLDSLIQQLGITFEIVIADDGSEDSKYKLVEQYFQKKAFPNYKLVENTTNQGTVANLISGLNVASGQYVKTISPGDSLCDNEILSKWVSYMKKSACKWSFSDAFYYRRDNEEIVPVNEKAHPQNIMPYLKDNKKECRWNYVVLDDIAMGAAMLCEKELEIAYCKKILGKVKYAEDNIWRMMMFDGVVGGYYPNRTVYYEYGTGVSTANNSIWNQRLMNDWNAANNIMFDQTRELDDFQIEMIRAVQQKQKGYLSKLMIKGKLKQFIYSKIKKRMTMVP